MYNMIIVDDEFPTREGMKGILDWEALNINISGTAASGYEGIELIKNNQIDIIITDIRMKAMDGLSMIEKLNEIGYSGEIIVISGYGLFEYAQKAMGIGVSRYLLKPIDREELKKAILEVEETIEKKRNVELFQKLDCFKAVTEALMENESDFEFKSGFEESVFVTAKSDIKLVHNSAEKVEIYKKIYGVLTRPYLSFASSSQIDMIICAGQQDKLKEVEGLIGAKLYIGISIPYTDSGKIQTAYRQAYIAMQNSQSRENGIVVYNDGMNKRIDSYFDNAAREIICSVENGDYDAARARFGDSFSTAIDEKYLPEDIYKWTEYLFRRMGDVIQNDSGEKELLKEYTEKFNKRNYSILSLKRMTDGFFDKCQKFQNTQELEYNIKSVLKVIQYIDEHYMEDISLQQLSKEVFINISYLSRLIKSHTKCTYIDYITKLRIDKAKQLLKDPNLAVYEVANMLNYQDPKYFSHLFKKFVGETPREYRMKYKQKKKPT